MNASCGTVLVVDDDRSIRETLAYVLEDEGYAVQQARNGEEAISQLRAQPPIVPCVILLDLMMPVMDGFAFRDAQLHDARLSAIPVVVLSADPNLKSSAARLRVETALTKPFMLEDILKTVEKYC